MAKRTDRDPSGIGPLLQRRRGARSLRDVADAVGVDASTLRKIENDTILDARFSLVAALAKALGFSLDELAADAGMLPRRRKLSPTGVAAEDLAPVAAALDETRRLLSDVRRRAPKRG